MAAATSTVPLGALLRQYHLGLVVVAGSSEGMHERPVQWVHASELEDPTPFLPPRTVLLTTGARFSSLSQRHDADAYVRRLIDAGTTAVGFAVGLHWDRVPAHFIASCDEQGLPIFRVPYNTAFIEIVQTAAGLIAAQLRERDIWTLESQRAVAHASLHRDGLAATLREASARLGRWVWVSDRAGRTIAQASQPGDPAPPIEDLRREVRRLVERGVSTIRVEPEDGRGIRLQTLGREGRMLGVLAVADRGAPDTAERTVTEFVAALSTAQLEHRNTLDEAHATLHSAAARLLIEGHGSVAEHLRNTALPRLPEDPLTVIRAAGPLTHDLPALLPARSRGEGSILHASYDGTPILILETAQLAPLKQTLAELSLTAGVSLSGPRSKLPTLLAQADRALEHAIRVGRPGPVGYTPSLHDGMLHLLEDLPDTRVRAEMLLAPLRTHDMRHGDVIERSLAVWLAHHGQTSPAASELGVHRHTLRNRVTTAAELLQLDLDSPDTRAELWAALRFAAADPAATQADKR